MNEALPGQVCVDAVDLYQDNRCVDQAEEGYHHLGFVELRVGEETRVTGNDRVNLELAETKDSPPEVAPEGCLAHSLRTLVDPVLPDLEQVLHEAAACLQKCCQINKGDVEVGLERYTKLTLQNGS